MSLPLLWFNPLLLFFVFGPRYSWLRPAGRGDNGGNGDGPLAPKADPRGGDPHGRGGGGGGRGGRGGGGDGRDGGPGRGGGGRGKGDGSGGGGGGGKGGGGEDEGWSRGDSSVSPLIPPFLRKLYMALPRHIGPQPDAEGLLKALRERALPDKPR